MSQSKFLQEEYSKKIRQAANKAAINVAIADLVAARKVRHADGGKRLIKSNHSYKNVVASLQSVGVDITYDAPMKREKCSRRAIFKEVEQPELSSLPAMEYQLKSFSKATVHKTSHVYLSKDKHYYSVPFAYIGKKVLLIYSKTAIEVYYGQRRIAFHERIYSKYGYTTLKEHMPSSYQYMTEWNPDRFISWAQGIGENTEEYIIKVLEKKQHPEQSYKSCAGILHLAKKVGHQRLDNACKRALGYERYGLMPIKSILDKGLDNLQDDEHFFEELKLPKHKNIRGGKYYQ